MGVGWLMAVSTSTIRATTGKSQAQERAFLLSKMDIHCAYIYIYVYTQTCFPTQARAHRWLAVLPFAWASAPCQAAPICRPRLSAQSLGWRAATTTESRTNTWARSSQSRSRECPGRVLTNKTSPFNRLSLEVASPLLLLSSHRDSLPRALPPPPPTVNQSINQSIKKKKAGQPSPCF